MLRSGQTQAGGPGGGVAGFFGHATSSFGQPVGTPSAVPSDSRASRGLTSATRAPGFRGVKDGIGGVALLTTPTPSTGGAVPSAQGFFGGRGVHTASAASASASASASTSASVIVSGSSTSSAGTDGAATRYVTTGARVGANILESRHALDALSTDTGAWYTCAAMCGVIEPGVRPSFAVDASGAVVGLDTGSLQEAFVRDSRRALAAQFTVGVPLVYGPGTHITASSSLSISARRSTLQNRGYLSGVALSSSVVAFNMVRGSTSRVVLPTWVQPADALMDSPVRCDDVSALAALDVAVQEGSVPSLSECVRLALCATSVPTAPANVTRPIQAAASAFTAAVHNALVAMEPCRNRMVDKAQYITVTFTGFTALHSGTPSVLQEFRTQTSSGAGAGAGASAGASAVHIPSRTLPRPDGIGDTRLSVPLVLVPAAATVGETPTELEPISGETLAQWRPVAELLIRFGAACVPLTYLRRTVASALIGVTEGVLSVAASEGSDVSRRLIIGGVVPAVGHSPLIPARCESDSWRSLSEEWPRVMRHLSLVLRHVLDEAVSTIQSGGTPAVRPELLCHAACPFAPFLPFKWLTSGQARPAALKGLSQDCAELRLDTQHAWMSSAGCPGVDSVRTLVSKFKLVHVASANSTSPLSGDVLFMSSGEGSPFKRARSTPSPSPTSEVDALVSGAMAAMQLLPSVKRSLWAAASPVDNATPVFPSGWETFGAAPASAEGVVLTLDHARRLLLGEKSVGISGMGHQARVRVAPHEELVTKPGTKSTSARGVSPLAQLSTASVHSSVLTLSSGAIGTTIRVPRVNNAFI